MSYGAPPTGAEAAIYDVAIVGAGVVGCALAYELSQYALRVVVLDRNHDVGEGTSKANSAIIHTGFDAAPGTLESELVTRASREWPALADRLKVPFLQTSALLVAVSEEQEQRLPGLLERARDNGVDDVRMVSAEEARRMEPNLTAAVRSALLVPREGVIDPFAVSIAFAEVALHNGVDFALGCAVTAMADRDAPTMRVLCSTGSVQARIVVNAAGLGSRALADQYGGARFDINPRRGQFVIYDRHARSLVQRILLPIPTERSKGMLVAPTVFGNLLAGPTAEDLAPDAVDATHTTVDGLAQVQASAVAMCPALETQPVIAAYAGLRCHCAQGSYWIRFNDGHRGMVTVSGVRSTGLSSSISLARHLIAGMVRACDLVLRANPAAVDSRPASCWPGWWRRPYEDAARVAARAEYGAIVCACEQVSRGEIVDALDSPLAPRTLDAIKRRTRALTGRCQGFQCGVAVARIIHEHGGIPLHRVTKRGPGSEIASGEAAPRPARELAPRPARELAPQPGRQPVPRPAREPAPRPARARAHVRVAVVGAGPAGVGVAVGLARQGIEPVLVLERSHEPGGVPARYAARAGGVPTFVLWTRGRVVFGRDYAETLARELAATSSEVWLEAQVVAMSRAARTLTVVRPGVGAVEVSADAIVLACGSREMSVVERGWIAGQRPARVFPTMQLLDLLDGHGCLPVERPVVLGSDLIAYATAAKLRAGGAAEATLVDVRRRPAADLASRLFFRRWTRPRWLGGAGAAHIVGSGEAAQAQLAGSKVAQVQIAEDVTLPCDGVIVSGELVPNSELAVEAGLDVALPGRRPVLDGGVRWREPGWFAAGNIVGGFHGAQWCYFHGKKAARAVAAYLRQASRS